MQARRFSLPRGRLSRIYNFVLGNNHGLSWITFSAFPSRLTATSRKLALRRSNRGSQAAGRSHQRVQFSATCKLCARLCDQGSSSTRGPSHRHCTPWSTWINSGCLSGRTQRARFRPEYPSAVAPQLCRLQTDAKCWSLSFALRGGRAIVPSNSTSSTWLGQCSLINRWVRCYCLGLQGEELCYQVYYQWPKYLFKDTPQA